MAGATATFSRDIRRGKRAPERQLFLPETGLHFGFLGDSRRYLDAA